MKLVIIGSLRKFYRDVMDTAVIFRKNGYTVLFPKHSKAIETNTNFALFESDISCHVKEIEDSLLEKIKLSDFVYLVNPGGYIGISATFEIGYANAVRTPVYALERPKDTTIPFYIKAVLKPDELVNNNRSPDKPDNSPLHLVFDADDTLWESQSVLQNS